MLQEVLAAELKGALYEQIKALSVDDNHLLSSYRTYQQVKDQEAVEVEAEQEGQRVQLHRIKPQP